MSTSEKYISEALVKDKAKIPVSLRIKDGSVVTSKLADGAVTTPKIADLNVTTEKLKNSVVTTEKVADKSITTSKLADSAVTSDKIQDGAVAWKDLEETVQKILQLTYDLLTMPPGNNSNAYIVVKNLAAHLTDYTNPHQVTKAQVGLGSVENYSPTGLWSLVTKSAIDAKLGFTTVELTATNIAKALGFMPVQYTIADADESVVYANLAVYGK